MAEYELNTGVLKTVEAQIINNEPPCTRLAFNRLMEAGCPQMDTLEMIGNVLVEHMNNVMMFGQKFDEAHFALKLDELARKYENYEPKEIELDEIQKEKHAGYNAMMSDDQENMAKAWLHGFELIKELVKNQFPDSKPDLQAVEEKTEFKYGLMSWLGDIERELGNAKLEEERIEYCKALLETFIWGKEAQDGFKATIGEAYCELGKEADWVNIFEEWLSQEPNNMIAVNSYLYCLTTAGKAEKAKEVAKQYITEDMECDIDTETMFYRAQSLFEEAGDDRQAEVYRKKISAFHSKCLDMAKTYETEVRGFKPGQERKVYPNDPCPCGSGKKYKKCCGNK